MSHVQAREGMAVPMIVPTPDGEMVEDVYGEILDVISQNMSNGGQGEAVARVRIPGWEDQTYLITQGALQQAAEMGWNQG